MLHQQRAVAGVRPQGRDRLHDRRGPVTRVEPAQFGEQPQRLAREHQPVAWQGSVEPRVADEQHVAVAAVGARVPMEPGLGGAFGEFGGQVRFEAGPAPAQQAVHRRGFSNGAHSDVELREFFDKDAISLDLKGETKDEILKELIGLLGVDEKSEAILFKMLRRRENLGSTGIGRGIAIPHCRSLVVNRLRVAFGRKKNGIDYGAIDGKPVHYFFLIVAPPLEVSNQYLPVLGKVAQFAKEPDVPSRLAEIETPEEFLKLLEEKSV